MLKKLLIWLGLAKKIDDEIGLCADGQCGQMLQLSKMLLLRVTKSGNSIVTYFCPTCYKKMRLGQKIVDISITEK